MFLLKLLATHYEKDLINIAILRDGQKLLLLTPTHLKHYYLLCQRLQFDRNLLENKQFLYVSFNTTFKALLRKSTIHKTRKEHSMSLLHKLFFKLNLPTIKTTVYKHSSFKMATNFSMELLALLSSDTLYILHLESFERKCYVSQVVSLKWSPDSTKVGILSNQDTLALVDVVNGQLLWTLDLKLRFFVDISVVDDTLYAMGNKFMLSRLSDGKEIETNNVHQEGISLKASSTLLLSTKQVHFVSSSGGNVIRMEHETAENAAVVNCPDQSSISTIFYDPKKDQMFVGFEDGKVICFEVMSAENEKRTEDQVVHSNDFVLCPVSDVLKRETELKNLTVQCNLIRGQSERILDEYKEIKAITCIERELSDVRGELESTLQAMREKMKRAEERYEAIETSKEEAFARMKQEMVDTVNDQKKYYEKMVNDQIKASIEKEESQTKQLHDIETDFQAKIAQLQETFKREEKKAQRNVTKFNLEKQKLTSDIKLLQSHEKSLVRKHAEEKRQFELRLEQEQKNHDERSQENAYLLREREAKETCDATIADLRTELITRNEEIEKLKAEVEQFTVSIEQETAKSTDLSKKLETSKRNHDVLFQKQKLLSSELASEKQLRHAHQRRLKHFEMLVDELSEHIYEPRRLEQNVLGLLAFFNSVPKSGQMQTNEQVNSVEKKKSGVTKRIVQLGNARHKAH
ncbi:hypothetical protein M3Y97_00502300 [Aphelenchoides bicaudatus]|nr:hypothetical protein M3Y97_00502300 [Aphelenchoides bicaudatus]